MKYLAKVENNILVAYVKNEQKYIDLMIKKGVNFSSWIETDFNFDESEKYRYENNNFIEIDKDEIEKEYLIKEYTLKIKNKAIVKIQTIPKKIRTSILDREKTNDKFYNETWNFFCLTCQNLIINKKTPKKRKNDALFVIERIRKFTDKKREIIKQLENMSLEQLKNFKVDDENIWEPTIKNQKNVFKKTLSFLSLGKL